MSYPNIRRSVIGILGRIQKPIVQRNVIGKLIKKETGPKVAKRKYKHMAGGRPQEYKADETIKLCREYLDACIDEEYERIKTDGDKSTSYDNLVRVKIPTIEGLAVHLKIARSTIYEWKDTYSEFSDIIEELQATQAERLLNNGLSGTYNPTIAKVLLTKHGYVEKQELDHTTKGKEITGINYIVPDGNNPKTNS